MSWFGYVWVVILGIAWLIWTIKCVIDFIRDVRGRWKLSFLAQQGASWAVWAIAHLILIFVSSFIYMIVGAVK